MSNRICPTCHVTWAAEEFGRSYYCKPCMAARRRKWRRENPEKAKNEWRSVPKERRAEQFKRWHYSNREKQREKRKRYHLAKHESELEKARTWKRNNRGRVQALVAKRTAAKLRAIPAWADLQAIEIIYVEARRLTELTGIKHHVDHIVPLQSPWVCGLHCEANLRIIPFYENQTKSNRWWPDMPDLEGCVPEQLAA